MSRQIVTVMVELERKGVWAQIECRQGMHMWNFTNVNSVCRHFSFCFIQLSTTVTEI
jgi:hypothetical protein